MENILGHTQFSVLDKFEPGTCRALQFSPLFDFLTPPIIWSRMTLTNACFFPVGYYYYQFGRWLGEVFRGTFCSQPVTRDCQVSNCIGADTV